MNEALRIMDNQVLKWVKELDELYKRKKDVDEDIQQLEQRIAKTKEIYAVFTAE